MSHSSPHSASAQPRDQASLSQAAHEPPAKISYHYQPLPSHEHFRLLELFPGSDAATSSGGVRCRLHTELVAEAEDKYAALSYVWGDSRNRVPIVCDERIVKVTVNLADALRHIRDHTEYKFVWADAICINQVDNEEKGHQVKRMRKVYENAIEVLVWLGKDDEGVAEDCFSLIRETNEHLDHQLEIYGKVIEIPPFIRESPISFDKSRWDRVRKLIDLPWFSRLWVLQEAALAKQCRLLWGENQLSLAELCEMCYFFTYRSDLWTLAGSLTFGMVIDSFEVQRTYRTMKSWMGTKPLMKLELKEARNRIFLDVLSVGRLLKVSFEVDRVYAFLGNPLARKHGEQESLIEPDYGKSMQEVYFEVACELLAHPREAPYLLACVDHHSSDSVKGTTLGRDGAFPSWVPRWDKNYRQALISHPTYWFQASGLQTKFEATVQNDKSLLLSGIIFDKIVWTSDIIDGYNILLNTDRWSKDTTTSGKPFIDLLFTQVQQAFYQHFPSRRYKLYTISMEDAFSLTMMRHYPAKPPDRFDLIAHQREYSAYLQAARKLAGTLTKKGTSGAVRKWLASFRRTAKPPQLQDAVQNIGETSPFTYERRLHFNSFRRFAITKSGRFGLVPWLAEPNDVCCVCPGMQVPLILRSIEDGRYGLVGDSYIHGVMAGEVMGELEKGEVKLENIVLV
ncbi:HET-domain-containing protein [Stipitochalara longipes BDJ]|nr:HET-domain-containing protein [Stipitochalara longipes BDJ]